MLQNPEKFYFDSLFKIEQVEHSASALTLRLQTLRQLLDVSHSDHTLLLKYKFDFHHFLISLKTNLVIFFFHLKPPWNVSLCLKSSSQNQNTSFIRKWCLGEIHCLNYAFRKDFLYCVTLAVFILTSSSFPQMRMRMMKKTKTLRMRMNGKTSDFFFFSPLTISWMIMTLKLFLSF